MKALYDVCAPAKLNLFLHITGRRADGLHLLQSVFMLIDWCDTLHFELRTDGEISREDLGPTLPADDLIVRAARALQAVRSTDFGVRIGLQKRIPIQAGMGGGSSDAASTLLALNRLWKLDLPLSRLAAIGLKLGAYVPFFLHGHNAWVEGVGEKMTPITLPNARFVVVKPPSGLDTAMIFSHPGLKRDTATAIISGFAEDPFAFGQNDLQSVAQSLCPGMKQALAWLASCDLDGEVKGGVVSGVKGDVEGGGSGRLNGRMTGSGSAVFAHVDADTFVHNDLQNPPSGFQVRLCSNLQAHPLLGWAACDG